MVATADFIVLGLGAMGSAAAQQLTARGYSVLGFDRFTPPHTQGSSHGLSRMYRQAYWEDPRYVPLLLRAFTMWQQLGREAGAPLFHLTGGLAIGRRDSELLTRTVESAERYALPHTLLSGDELAERYPALAAMVAQAPDLAAVLEANAGYVLPEETIRHQLACARQRGAQLHVDEAVLQWSKDRTGVTVQTSRGTYSGAHLVVTAGPWAGQMLQHSGLPLRVTRQVLFWFDPATRAGDFAEGKLPVFLFEAPPLTPMVYGFPQAAPGAGVKVALHGSDQQTEPSSVSRQVTPEDEALMRERLRTTLPALADARLLHAETCLYTMTPDEHFIIDRLSDCEQVTIAAGFSGHGFKFTPVIGEILADLAIDGTTPWDIGLFSLARFSAAAP